jgi:hypothetical protein
MKPLHIIASVVLASICVAVFSLATKSHHPGDTPNASRIDQIGLPISVPPPASRGAESSGPRDSFTVPTDLPPRLAAIINSLRSSADEVQRNWAQVIAAGWGDFGKGVIAIREFFPSDQVEFRIAQLFVLIHGETLKDYNKHLEYIANGHERAAVAASVAQQWAKYDPQALARFASMELTGEAKNRVLVEAARALIKTGDFYQADQLVKQMPFSSGRSAALEELAARWGKEQPAAALEWAQRLELPEDRRAAESRILGVSGLPVEELVNFANSTSDGESRTVAINALTNQLVSTDVEAATQWVAKVPEQYRAGIQGKIAAKLAQSDQVRGTEYAVDIADPKARLSAIDAITRDIVMKDPRSAARWLESLPPDLRERAAFNTVVMWYDIDSMQASDWINTLPHGKVRDRALVALSSRLTASDPEAAKAVASQIADPALRSGALSGL